MRVHCKHDFVQQKAGKGAASAQSETSTADVPPGHKGCHVYDGCGKGRFISTPNMRTMPEKREVRESTVL